MKGQPSANLRSLLIAVALLAWAFLSTGSGNAQSGYQPDLAGTPTPETTVIVSNATDGRFSRDFSPLLKNLRLPWVIVDSAAVPAAVKDKNLIILGRPDDSHTGAMIRRLLAEDELKTIRVSADKPHVLTKESPWTPGRSVTICTGSSSLLTRDAAEQAVRAIITNTPPASAWIQTTFDGPLDDALRTHVEQLRFTWDDEELPLAELLIDAGARPRLLISAADATEDVEHLFNLFAHGYAGYAFFNQHGEFAHPGGTLHAVQLDHRRLRRPAPGAARLYHRLSPENRRVPIRRPRQFLVRHDPGTLARQCRLLICGRWRNVYAALHQRCGSGSVSSSLAQCAREGRLPAGLACRGIPGAAVAARD